MTQNISFVLLILAIALETLALTLALRLALDKRTWQKWPARWAWFFTAVGLVLLLARRVVTFASRLVALSPATQQDLLTDSIIAAITSAMLLVAMLALSRHMLRTAKASQRQELGAVRQVGLAASTLALNDVLQQVYEQVRPLIPLEAFCIALYDEANDELHA